MQARRRIRLAALVVAVVGVLTAVPTGAPAPVAAAVAFEVRGSMEQVATWGHAPGSQVSIRRVGDAWSLSRAADAQGAVLFKDLTPGEQYVVGGAGGEAEPVTVLDPEAHPAPSSYAGIDLEPGYGYIPTRDGTLLSANIVMPFAGTTTGRRPVVVTYSGYDPSNPASLPPEALPYAARGYVVVAVNMRGSGCSGGAFDYYEPATSTDGYDVIEAVAAQDWSNGRVGMVGISYSGISQLYVAATQPPHLRAITPLSPYSDAYRGILYPGGIRNEGFALQWALDRQAAAQPAARPWVQQRIAEGDTVCEDNQVLRLQSRDLEEEISPERYDSDEYQYLAITSFADRIEVPTYLAVQFQDEQTGGSAVELARILQNTARPFRAVFGNGAHADPMGPSELPRVMEFIDLYVGQQVPDISFLRPLLPDILDDLFEQPIEIPPDRFAGMTYQQAKTAYEAEKPIRVRYEVGGVAGKEGAPYATTERTYASWPVPGTVAQRWYLQPDGALSATTPPDAIADGSARATSSYRYAPDEIRPPTFDGATDDLWKRHPDVDWDSPAEDTALTFTTPPATATSVYAGSGSVDVWVGSTAADTDLEAVLTEVRPDGQEVYVQSGWLRVSQRALDTARSRPLRPWPTHYEEDAAPIPAGEMVSVRLALFPFAHVLRPGSRLRLSIEAPGGNQPLWDYTELDLPATNTVGHSVGHPSSVALPLLHDPGAISALPRTAPSCSVPGVATQAQSLRNQPCRADRSPRRPGDVRVLPFGYGEPGAGGIEVRWTAPVRWPGTNGPTGYTIDIPELERSMSVSGTSATVVDVPRETPVTVVVTPVYAGGGGFASHPTAPVAVPAETDGEVFVRAAYQDFLDRSATSEDLVQEAVAIDTGERSRRSLLAELAGSEEWVAAIVDQLYEDTLGRPGDPGGRAFWIDAIRSGRVTVAKAAAGFYASAEYLARLGSLHRWVADLYDTILGRPSSDADEAYWVGHVPRMGRGWVALQIFQSAESAADRVEALYQALLGRSAEPGAIAFWGPRVVARGDIALAVDLAASAEYLARAHQRFD